MLARILSHQTMAALHLYLLMLIIPKHPDILSVIMPYLKPRLYSSALATKPLTRIGSGLLAKLTSVIHDEAAVVDAV
jgi:hypothetical protein